MTTTPNKDEEASHFSLESLILSMAPIDIVIDEFLKRRVSGAAPANSSLWHHLNGDGDGDPDECDGQAAFASLVTATSSSSTSSTNAEPQIVGISSRYVQKLVTRFVSRMEGQGGRQVQDESLAELLAQQMTTTPTTTPPRHSQPLAMDVPCPQESAHVSFLLPPSPPLDPNDKATNNTNDATAAATKNEPWLSNDRGGEGRDATTRITLRIFPHDNHVGVRRVWEAGCCLVEFLWTHHSLVQGCNVVELGSGVGLTGIALAKQWKGTGPTHIHMTDVSHTCLENLQHNVWLNAGEHHLRQPDSDYNCRISTGCLEWSEFANETDTSRQQREETLIQGWTRHNNESSDKDKNWPQTMPFLLSETDVLLAADVVYEVGDIPALVKTVQTILEEPSPDEKKPKRAIFATTVRNQHTFATFQNELNAARIHCQHFHPESISNLPHIFPLFFQQPRSDVRITLMTAAPEP